MNREAILKEIDKILAVQEEFYYEHTEESRIQLASSCVDSFFVSSAEEWLAKKR